MSNSISKLCDRCETVQIFVPASDKRYTYLQCKGCAKRNIKAYKVRNWQLNLARKANNRKREGYEVLTEADITLLNDRQLGKCALSGLEMIPGHGILQPSLDRIDNNQSYVIGNLQLVCWCVNRAKSTMRDAEFVSMCVAVTNNFLSNNY